MFRSDQTDPIPHDVPSNCTPNMQLLSIVKFHWSHQNGENVCLGNGWLL